MNTRPVPAPPLGIGLYVILAVLAGIALIGFGLYFGATI